MHLSRMSLAWLAAGIGACALLACGGGGSSDSSGGAAAGGGAMGAAYVVTPLVSDAKTGPYKTAYVDPNLVNGWGIAFNPNGFVWVANAGTSTSTLYDGNGVPQSLVVAIPSGVADKANPTGIVYNGTQDFKITQAAMTAASVFIFVGETGAVSAWSPGVNLNSALKVYDGAAAGSVYKGLALAAQGGANFLYAADFHNAGVDVFNGSFAKVSMAGGFRDAMLPVGYAPFGIQAIGNLIYVAYAKQDAQRQDEVQGAGLGAVNVFDPAGNLVRRLIVGGPLNAPWGMAMAPANFGPFSNALLVGNFGDGKVNAFSPDTGAFLGALTSAGGTPIVIDGLWGIAFGNGINNQPTNTLFFAAGPSDETHGLYGRIDNQ